MERDEHRVGGGQGVDREKPERRRAVDEDVVVAIGDVPDEPGEPAFPSLDRRELDLGAGERDGRWDDVESPSGPRDDEVGEGALIDDGVVDGALERVRSRPKPARGVALRVQVDDEDALAGEREIARRD